MSALSLIGWAFIAGLCVVAFLLPIYILDALFKAREK
jgi:hypothetical protein